MGLPRRLASMASAWMMIEVPMSQITGVPCVGKPKHMGLVPKRPSVAPCGATQAEALEAIMPTRPCATIISAE